VARAGIFNFLGASFLGVGCFYSLLQDMVTAQRLESEDQQSGAWNIFDSTQYLSHHLGATGGGRPPSHQPPLHPLGHPAGSRQGLQTTIRRGTQMGGAVHDRRGVKTSLNTMEDNLGIPGDGGDMRQNL